MGFFSGKEGAPGTENIVTSIVIVVISVRMDGFELSMVGIPAIIMSVFQREGISMYCMKCGAQNSEDAKFCIKCGSRTDGSDLDNIVVSGSSKSQKKSRVWIPIVIGSGILALLCIFILAGGSSDSKKLARGNSSDANEKSFSLDEISEQCPGCRNALEAYLNLIESSKSLNSTSESIDYYCMELYYAMQHNCTAKTIRVENIPYAYQGSVGTYTGEWKGAGPYGYGTYQGSVYWSDAVSYTGEWLNGLPDGEGELYHENFKGGWDMDYKGHMTAGRRNGVGRMVEYLEDGHPPKYRIYDVTTFQNDIMCQQTQCVEYAAETGEVLYNYIMNGSDNGWVYSVAEWSANELSPSERQALEFAECAIVIGAVGYIIDSAIDPGGFDYDKADADMLDNLNSWREEKAAEEQEAISRQQEEEESYRNYCADQYDKLHAQDPSDWSLDAQYFKYNMY